MADRRKFDVVRSNRIGSIEGPLPSSIQFWSVHCPGNHERIHFTQHMSNLRQPQTETSLVIFSTNITQTCIQLFPYSPKEQGSADAINCQLTVQGQIVEP